MLPKRECNKTNQANLETDEEIAKLSSNELYERGKKALKRKKSLGFVANPQFEEALFYFAQAYKKYIVKGKCRYISMIKVK